MFKLINSKGFSLAELMVSVGIVSVITVVIMNSQQVAVNATNEVASQTEINVLVQQLTTMLARKDACEKNFNPTGTPTLSYTTISMSGIKNQNGVNIITANQDYGKEIKILTIDAIPGAADQLNVTVRYQPRKSISKKYSNQDLKFIIPVNVFLDAGTAKINTCYSDVQSLLKTAVQNACQGNGARHLAGVGSSLGSCEHQISLRNEADGIVAPVGNAFICPAGQFLQRVDTGVAGIAGQWVFRCATASTTDCAAWEYLEGIDASGNKVCKDVRSLFVGTGLAVIRNGVYTLQNLSCASNEVLRKIKPDGTLDCINPRLQYACPPNQYVEKTDGAGGVTCKYYTNSNVCGGGTYIRSIDALGNVTCVSPAPPNSCASNQVITGIDASGYLICGAMP